MSNQPKNLIEFDLEDVGVIWHALNLQSSTDMMYGKEGSISRKRCKQKADVLRESYPLICNHHIKEYGWLNAVIAARSCKELEISQKAELDWDQYTKSDYKEKKVNTKWLQTHPILIRVDDQVFKLSDRIVYNREYLEGLRELISQVMPLDAKLHPIAELTL